MRIKEGLLIICMVLLWQSSIAQGILEGTRIQGFVHFNGAYDLEVRKPSFEVGEQDFFITSEVTDKLTFLGESVIKYTSDHDFIASLERVIFNYNYKGNHNILAGKHHTPINFWNDSYHHGRVFFPTIDRPLLFSNNIIPIHTIGVSFQGQNLTKVRLGYDVMFGNGISSGDIPENSNESLSITIALHVKPLDGMRVGITAYYDKLDETIDLGGHHSTGTSYEALDQQIYTAYFSHISEKIEVITEGSVVINRGDVSGSNQSLAYYGYIGVPLKGLSITPYVRFDWLSFSDEEVYFVPNNKDQLVAGIRHDFNYRSVLKLEYQFRTTEGSPWENMLKTQVAIGF